MITREQLDEAICEMQGQRHPDANTCLKLASYYTIKKEMFPEGEPRQMDGYSYAPPTDTIDLDSGTEFAETVKRMSAGDAWRKLDEVMTALYVINPALYRRILRDLREP